LGHLQRGGSPTAFDRILGTRFGTAVIKLVNDGEFGKMVCLRGQRIQAVDLETAVGEMKRVAPDSQLVQTAESLGICLGR